MSFKDKVRQALNSRFGPSKGGELHPDPICPRCGLVSQRSITRYGQRNDCCGLKSWHGKSLQDPETLAARRAAHDIFDRLWDGENRIMCRRSAYAQLSEELGLHPDDTHMAQMTLEQALKVPAAVERIRKRHADGLFESRHALKQRERERYIDRLGFELGILFCVSWLWFFCLACHGDLVAKVLAGPSVSLWVQGYLMVLSRLRDYRKYISRKY